MTPEVFLEMDPIGWPSGVIVIPPNNEIAVYPMTISDSILLKHPDGLMNGSAIASIIGQRVPAVRDPWSIPEHQINRIIAALHLATHGANATISYKCDKCNEINDLIINTSAILDNKNLPKYDPLYIDDLIIEFQPLLYKEVVHNRNQTYRLAKVIQSISPTNKIDGVILQKEIHNHMLAKTNSSAQRIKKIQTKNAVVTDQNLIAQFLSNANKKIVDSVAERINQIDEAMLPAVSKVQCDSCQHTTNLAITLDPTEEFKTKIQTLDNEKISEYFEQLEKQIKEIRQEAMKICWFMRGSLSYNDVLNLTNAELKTAVELINDNLQTTKKTGMPFF